MKKIYFLTISVLVTNIFFAQTVATLETEISGSTNFTQNGVIFNIISNNAPTSLFNIRNSTGNGWSGTSTDNRFIDNTGTSTETDVSFSIKTTSNLFKVRQLWIFLSNNSLNQNVTGTLNIQGKLSGITKFTATKTTGFATGLGSTNGYTLIDLTNFSGMSYSNIIVDEIKITLGGAYTYARLDAFTWVKDNNVVLANSDFEKESQLSIYPNPTSDVIYLKYFGDVENVKIYDFTGKLIQSNDNSVEINVSKLEKGTYIAKIKTENGIVKSKFIKN